MQRSKVILIGVLGFLSLAGVTRLFAAPVESDTKMRTVSGEIVSVDVKLGLLQLKSDAGRDAGRITEYKINQQETRVTDPSDKKFLVIKDLQVGQHVTAQLVDRSEERLIRKIVAEPMPGPVFQEATGELEAIDVQTGTLVIEQRPSPNEAGQSNLSYFVFDPRELVFMRAPDMEPVQGELKPGDLVKVEFAAKEGKRQARSITLLSAAPETRSTTTTTTTSTTVTR